MGKALKKRYDITVVVTHRCNAKCIMCNSHEHPSRPDEEVTPALLEKLPKANFIQITGGEPFLRTDLEEIVTVLKRRSKRLMIITNGYFTERIVSLCKKHPDLAMRVSIDGREEVHNAVRGINIYQNAMQTVQELKRIGVKDLGIGFTLQQENHEELLPMYLESVREGVDFGVSVIHNSYFFQKKDNVVEQNGILEREMRKLVSEELHSKRFRDWERAFFNDYSIRHIRGEEIEIACEAGTQSFFLEANGDVLPCNMTMSPWVMGNLNESDWGAIMGSVEAHKVIERCKKCRLNCWSICNVQTAIRKRIWVPIGWLIKNKLIGFYEK